MNRGVGAREAHFVKGLISCPRCGNGEFEAVSDGELTNFLCLQCWTCWHWELDFLTPIPARTCPGCHHKEECLRREAPDQAPRAGSPAGAPEVGSRAGTSRARKSA